MLIWLIRHGLTELGEEKRYQGVTDTGLSEAGMRALHEADCCPDVVYVSPALRCRETAAILFPTVRQLVISNLCEMNFGRFEGRGWWEMEEDPDYLRWTEGGCIGRCPGGEDRAEFSRRVCDAFSSLLEAALRESREELVIVAHGGTQMAVLERWGIPVREYYRWQTECGSGWLLDAKSWPRSLQVIREIDYRK